MKSLTGSTLNFSFVKYNEKYKGCPRESVLSKPDIRFLGCAAKPNHVNVSFSCSGSSQRERNRSIFPSSALSPKTQFEDNQMQNLGANQSKTVHVKFQLQKKCTYGQQFYIVGDDPMFGLWDPLEAIPMNWSDEHVWTVELDIPVGKMIKYKFILKGDKESVKWQPGKDRVVQIKETTKMMTVIEDWNDSKLQKIIQEEEPLMEPSKECAVDSDMIMVSQSTGSFQDGNGRVINGEKIPSLVPADVAELNTKEEASAETSDPQHTIELIVNENQEVQEDEPLEKPQLVVEEVLEDDIQWSELILNENQEVQKDEPLENPQLAVEKVLKDDIQWGHELILNENQEVKEDEPLEKPQLVVEEVLESDIQWGRKTLQNFLMNFGILK